LRGISLGFRPLESVPRKKSSGTHFLKQELVECSLVATPANPNALLEAKALGISNAMIREIFVQGNKNASLADRIFAARCAVKYTERQKREIHAKAKAMDAQTKADRSLAKARAVLAKPSPPPLRRPGELSPKAEKALAESRARSKAKQAAADEARKGSEPQQFDPEEDKIWDKHAKQNFRPPWESDDEEE
jgi:hypothetical protein